MVVQAVAHLMVRLASHISPITFWLQQQFTSTHSAGFIYEHGPFDVQFAKGSEHSQDGRLILRQNPYTWSKAANIIYLDSPAGVTQLWLAKNPNCKQGRNSPT